MDNVAIVLLNYNTYEYSIECLKSLFRQKYKNYTILLVDNNSTNNSMKFICDFLDNSKVDYVCIDEREEIKVNDYNKTILIQANENNGYAAGNNIALKKAIKSNIFKYYWVINNDTIIKEDTLDKMVNCIKNDKLSRPVGNYVYYYDDKNKLQMAGGLKINRLNFKPKFSNDENNIDYLGGVSYLIDNDFIYKYGLMYEDYFLNSEDLEYFYKYKIEFKKKYLKENAFNVIGEIYHKESATQGKVSPMSNYYYSRNLLYSCKKLNPMRIIGLYIFFIFRIFKWGLKDRDMMKSILIAIKDYKSGVIGKVDYFNLKESVKLL